jgi:hypothetical protein
MQRMPPTAEQFQEELMRMMREGMRNAVRYVDINAGELHRRVGDYPGFWRQNPTIA